MSRLSSRFRLGTLLLILAVLAGAAPTSAMVPSGSPLEGGLSIAIDSMRQLATDSRENKKQKRTTKPRPGLPIDLGRDGRLTMLLIGSDWRPSGGGERTDVMMVATIDPTNGRAAIVSIPRDMAFIPLAGGGTSGATRVNSIYLLRYKRRSLEHKDVDRKALDKLTRDIARFLGTEIDHWAFTRFSTFTNLINTLGGVKVNVDDAVLDSSYHHGRSRGVWFPKSKNYRLRGDPKCKPKPRKCRSALVYTRSRKGTHGSTFNSDYRRAERQQELVFSAVRQVLKERGSGLAMLGLMLRVRPTIETSIPTTSEAAAQLYALLQKVKLSKSDMKVLEPGPFASAAEGSAIQPNVANVRAWVDKTFYNVKKRNRKNRAGDDGSSD